MTMRNFAGGRIRAAMLIVAAACATQPVVGDEGGTATVPAPTVRVVAGKKEGIEVLRRSNGTVREFITWAAGKRHGSYRSYWENGRTNEVGDYDQGLKVGTWREYNSDGEIVWERPYVNGERQGVVKQYFNDSDPKNNPQGLAEETTYKAGVKEGPCTGYWSNGRRSHHGTYVVGQRHGTWQFWSSEGKPFPSKTYEMGRKLEGD